MKNTPNRLMREYFKDPMGLDVAEPRLGWTVTSTGCVQAQTAYQIPTADHCVIRERT